MDEAGPAPLVCPCGRSFQQDNAYSSHRRSCKKSNKRTRELLEKSKEVYARKKLRLQQLRDANGPGPSGPTAQSQMAEQDVDAPLAHRRPQRLNRLLPARYRDELPVAAPSLPPVLPPPPPCPDLNTADPVATARQKRTLRTPRNLFGVVRQFFIDKIPAHDPDECVTIEELSSSATPSANPNPLPDPAKSLYPYPNKSSFNLGNWFWNGVQKSKRSFAELVKVISDPEFKPDDIAHTKWNEIDNILGNNLNDHHEDNWMDEDAGWKTSKVKISVPFHKRQATPGPCDYTAETDFHHRSLVDVLKERISDPHTGAHFHMEPYELRWKPNENHPEERLHGEIYTSPEFLEAHRLVQEAPGEPGCDLQRVVAALMFWSDGTHLTSFGVQRLWPLYMYLGNESKYRRCKPTCNLCSHVAYFQYLPDQFKDFANPRVGGKGPKPALFAHCRREFFHAQWGILLDDDFIEAYKHGIVIMCFDGIHRRFYPRILTYSADYPEKVLIALIKNMAACPCPRCLILLKRIGNLGMALDRRQRSQLLRKDDVHRKTAITSARRLIYEKNYAVDSKTLEGLLQPQSLVPTVNAFSDRLGPHGFNFFLMLVIDLMHEFELGVWKNLFIHLLRILAAKDPQLINELDYRYRQMPSFGKDTIRKFVANTSELKKLAARNFEDLLQCAIPVFDGLLPEPHNSAILKLLFTAAHWHGLAKLRLHSDSTLLIIDDITTSLGEVLHHFKDVICPAYNTKELPRETKARKRRKAHKAGAARSQATPTTALLKSYNLETYKNHSIGDTVDTIRRLGTTESYCSRVGELQHRTSKSGYLRTDRKLFERQLTKIERRVTRLRRIRHRLGIKPSRLSDDDRATSSSAHHHIGKSESLHMHIGTFIREHTGDPAVQDFVPKLKDHLLPRVQVLWGQMSNTEHPSTAMDASVEHLESTAIPETSHIFFKNDRLYRHNIMRVNYTTYDVRRKQDTINPRTSHRDVMVLSDSQDAGDHPYLYARVIGIFHVNVTYTGSRTMQVDYAPRRMEVLWVRWYELDPKATAGSWLSSRLDQLRFPPMDQPYSFGFLDPADVIRACHVMPKFRLGRRHEDGKGLSPCASDSKDWSAYFVDRFVDRDMLMRFHWGLAVGHVYTHRSKCDNPSISWPHNHRRTSASEATHDESHTRPGHEDMAEVVQPQAQDISNEGSDSEGSDVVPEEPDLASSEDEEEEGGGTMQDQGDSDDEEEVGLEDMYGYIDSEGDVDSGMD
ncbi:hypothetical protein FIBSPDRAFT_764436 [Athelia psychrophila]|uniref:Uncharacterized protein n=1 Tax=Athelia psychrophila TaxID=1759441 RepID=A0A167WRY5_9AGAM|nr:hypothetical protein FIBSPDRAFT_764436 [Fibularhizoctonia sp. CBS 109695]